MNKEKQRIAITEHLGWKGPFEYQWIREYEKEGGDLWCYAGIDPNGDLSPLPDYPNDLNAMREAENTLSSYDLESEYFWVELPKTCGSQWHQKASAPERAEAFLRTFRLWEE